MRTRSPSVALVVGASLALLLQLGLPAMSAHAQPAGSTPIADPAPGWVREPMPYLGYTIDLPASWERVGGDASTPVVSIDDIRTRDQVTADALAAAAQHIAADGGLLDAMGLWSVDPVSLLQLGVVAGQPYRIDAAALQDQVDASLTQRASDLQDPVVEPVSYPVGDGFRATYLDAVDLATHQELHLRTPTGRSLIVAASIPGALDASLDATLDAIARSITPIPGSAGDLPAPSEQDLATAAGLLHDALPARVGTLELRRETIDGETLVGTTAGDGAALASGLGALVRIPAQLTLGIAFPTTDGSDLLVAAYRLEGVEPSAVDALLATFPDLWERTRIGATDVLLSPVGEGGRRTWLAAAPLADGSAALVQVDTTNAALGRATVGAIVAGRTAPAS
ncbi:MAG: hypothetical protein KF809_16770 [Chloroflexi bacterium]|nr:hypothetical protein [Chloroflexota bacterium]